MLPDGQYAVQTKSGDCRLFMLKTVNGKRGEADDGLFGRRILSYKKPNGWQAFAFLNDNGSLQIYLRFLNESTPEQLDALRRAVDAIRADPQQAMELYRNLLRAKKAAG
jgi:hypothetical protein